MDKGKPMVSMVMAVYNGGELLRETIESVLSQTIQQFEFIIVDDGSTDNTVEIVRSYNDPRIRLIQPGRQASQGKCLNIGINAACSDLIARIDADDPAHPQRLEIQYKAIQSNPRTGVLGTGVKMLMGNGKATWDPLTKVDVQLKNVSSKILLFNPLAHSSVMIRRQAFQEAGGFDNALGSNIDYYLWGMIIDKGWELCQLPLTLQAKRIHKAQMFENKKRISYLWTSLRVQREIIKRLDASAMYLAFGFLRVVYGAVLPQKVRVWMRPLYVKHINLKEVVCQRGARPWQK